MQAFGVLLFFLVPIIFFIYMILDIRKFNQKKFSEYRKMYPEKTDQEIVNLIKKNFWSNEETSYCDTGW